MQKLAERANKRANIPNKHFPQLQVRALEAHGNWSSDWSLVRISAGSKSSTNTASSGGVAAGRVRGCFFHGPVLLGDLSGEVRTRRTQNKRGSEGTNECKTSVVCVCVYEV